MVQYFQLSGGRAPGRSSPSNFSSHHLWFSHAGFLYVDDFLFFMEANMMPVSAALVCIMCQLLGIPISWRKTALSSCIDYIGWQFNFFTGIVSIPVQKNSQVAGLYLPFTQELLWTLRKVSLKRPVKGNSNGPRPRLWKTTVFGGKIIMYVCVCMWKKYNACTLYMCIYIYTHRY